MRCGLLRCIVIYGYAVCAVCRTSACRCASVCCAVRCASVRRATSVGCVRCAVHHYIRGAWPIVRGCGGRNVGMRCVGTLGGKRRRKTAHRRLGERRKTPLRAGPWEEPGAVFYGAACADVPISKKITQAAHVSTLSGRPLV